jgi:hypothetical protein
MHSSTATLHGARTQIRDRALFLVAERRLKQADVRQISANHQRGAINQGREINEDPGRYLAAPKNTPLRTISRRRDRTDEVVGKFYTAIKEKKPRKLTFMDHLGFRLMQASYARVETMSPTDYVYWKEKGWLERDSRYFHDNVNWNWFKDLVPRLIGWITGRQVDKAMAEVT